MKKLLLILLFGVSSIFADSYTTEQVLARPMSARNIRAAIRSLNLNPLDITATDTTIAGDRGIQLNITHSDTLTGTLVGIYVRATGGDTAAAGTIRGAEIGGRMNTTPAGLSASVVTGGYFWADTKTQAVATALRGLEVSLDGGPGGTVPLASGIVIFNNSSGTQTASYAVDVNEGNPSGRKVFTADMRLQNGATFDNTTNHTFEWNENSDELIWTFGSNTVAVSSGDVTAFNFSGGISTTWAGSTSGGIKIAPIATGTATATIQNQNVAASTITLPSATTTLPGLTLANTWTGIQTFGNTAHVGVLLGSGASGLGTAFDAGSVAGNTKAMSFYLKSTSQLATDVLEGLYVNTYHGTDAAQPAPSGEAGRFRAYLTGDQAGAVALVGMHGTLELATGSSIGGLGAGIRGNIVYPNDAQSGTQYGIMAELYSGGTSTDMTSAVVTPLEIAISGTIDATKWANVPAFRIDVPASLVSTSAYILDTDAAGDDCDAKLKININGTDWWILLSNTND